MALLTEIQRAGNIVGDIGGVIGQGLSIFGDVRNTLHPSMPITAPVATPPREPIIQEPEWSVAEREARTTTPTLMGLGELGENPILLIGIAVVAYYLFIK